MTLLESRLRRNIDIPLVLFALALVGVGIASIYSASHASPTRFYLKQASWLVIGLGLMGLGASINPQRLPRLAKPLYVITLLLLVYTLKFGHSSHGAQRWILLGGFQLQPSELAKLAAIFMLAAYYSARSNVVEVFSTLLGSLGFTLPLFVLIFLQPDLGTALALMACWIGISFVAGVKPQHLAIVGVAGTLLFGVAWQANLVKPYQKARLTAFLNPDLDPKDVGYHVRQARIAIGSGQVTGKGYLQGTQVQGNFIPEKQTDFIFTVIGEEGGFVGATVVIVLYVGLFSRALWVMANAGDTFGRLTVAGILSLFGFHTIVNLGMNVGIMPVTGVPLPLVSYGGTSLWICLFSLGIVLSVGMRRHKLQF